MTRSDHARRTRYVVTQARRIAMHGGTLSEVAATVGIPRKSLPGVLRRADAAGIADTLAANQAACATPGRVLRTGGHPGADSDRREVRS